MYRGEYSLAEPYISQIFWEKTKASYDWYAYFAIAKIYGDKLADYLIYEIANDPNKIQLAVYDARYFGFIVGKGDSNIPQTSIRLPGETKTALSYHHGLSG